MKEPARLLSELTLLQKAALLSGANTWQTRQVEAAEIPAIWFADGPHGIRRQAGPADHLGLNASQPATCFPTAATVASSWDVALAEQIGAALGREARAQGVHVLLGPGLNIKRSPLGGRNFEYFSEDPEVSGALAAAYVRGTQSEGVAAAPKHFAVNSQELRRLVSDSVIDERTLREQYLTAFEIVVREARPWAIMSAYNLINGVYAHENAHLLRDILRDEWGFDGAVVSDWGGGNDPVAAVSAGGTLEMPSPGFDSARAIVAAVELGTLDEADLDARVMEILSLISRVSDGAAAAPVDLSAHHALARRAAAESAVLLRNTDGLLPLSAGTQVALIGDFAMSPRFQGAGSSFVNATRVTSLADAAEKSTIVVSAIAPGFRRDGHADATLLAAAVEAAKGAEVAVLALGLPEIAETEGLDRSTLSLPDNQVQVLRAVHAVNPRTVVVLSAGGAVETPWLSHAAALVHGYLGGQAGAEGMLDLLTGQVEPGGRLAETMPNALADTPTATRFPSTNRTAEYREGLYVGYKYYDTVAVDVAFPFGFGMGYTTFAYDDLKASSNEVIVSITNTGERPGAEVVQIYIGRSDPSSVYRPARELKAFAKVHLDAGETRRVTIQLGPRAFRHFDVITGRWQIESGRYLVDVARNVRDVVLSSPVEVTGTVAAGRDDGVPSSYLQGAVHDVSRDDFERLLGRTVPGADWGSAPLGYNDPIDRLASAPSRLARWVFGLLDARRLRAERAGRPDLNVLFILNAPFRTISKMSGGLATSRVTDAVLTLVNGQTVRGMARLVVAYFGGRRAERVTTKAFRVGADPVGPHSKKVV